jgi:uncharacterized protein YndB with AHSA1/START domain
MIDITQHLNSVRREVGHGTGAAGSSVTATISQIYDASIDDLWDACTSAERIPRWFLPISGELRLGGRYQLEGNAGGTIERCEPPNGFAATWEIGGDVSWIELRLTAEADGRTRFELRHTLPADEARWAEFGPGAVGVGWEMGLLGLAGHVSGQPTLEPRDAAAWVASEAGKQFIARSGQAWGQASVAAGADPAAARAAAERTTAAYTGSEAAA